MVRLDDRFAGRDRRGDPSVHLLRRCPRLACLPGGRGQGTYRPAPTGQRRARAHPGRRRGGHRRGGHRGTDHLRQRGRRTNARLRAGSPRRPRRVRGAVRFAARTVSAAHGRFTGPRHHRRADDLPPKRRVPATRGGHGGPQGDTCRSRPCGRGGGVPRHHRAPGSRADQAAVRQLGESRAAHAADLDSRRARDAVRRRRGRAAGDRPRHDRHGAAGQRATQPARQRHHRHGEARHRRLQRGSPPDRHLHPGR